MHNCLDAFNQGDTVTIAENEDTAGGETNSIKCGVVRTERSYRCITWAALDSRQKEKILMSERRATQK